MYVDRMLFPIRSLGPGNRLVLWTRGCSKHCAGCANPELWSTVGARDMAAEDIAKIILNIHRETPVDGITISGGDPLEQEQELLDLLSIIKPQINDVLVYTGYTYEEVEARLSSDELQRLRSLASVLIDGPYVEAMNTGEGALTGSNNQKIYYFDDSLRQKYEEYLLQGRKIENIHMGQRVISVGIHNRNEE